MNVRQLSSGQNIPVLGLGTWELTGETCYEAVQEALDLGYTHIDTADVYGNHKQIAAALKKAGVDRDGLFITTKVWRADLAYDRVGPAVEHMLDELGVDYVNLLLIHWPDRSVPMSETFRALAEVREKGWARDIGVSNFTEKHVGEATSVSSVPVVMNQVEYHPYLNQERLRDFCAQKRIALTAYSPLARGRALSDPVIKEIAVRHGRHPAQVVIRWLLDKDLVVIPKASSRDHLQTNLDVFDFELTDEDREKMERLDRGERFVKPSFHEFDL